MTNVFFGSGFCRVRAGSKMCARYEIAESRYENKVENKRIRKCVGKHMGLGINLKMAV